MQRYSDIQMKQKQEVFLYSFIDLFVDYMVSLSSSNVILYLLNEGWIFCSFEMHFGIPWSRLFIISISKVSPVSEILVWIHWNHYFT